MKKEIAITAALLVIVVALSIHYFLHYSVINQDKQVVDALPEETMLAFPLKGNGLLNPFETNSELLNTFLADTVFAGLRSDFKQVQLKFQSFSAKENDAEMVVALARVSHKELGILVIAKGAEMVDVLEQQLENANNEDGGLELLLDNTRYFAAIEDDIVIVSQKPLLIESAKAALDRDSKSLIAEKFRINDHDLMLNYDLLTWLVPNVFSESIAAISSSISGLKGYGFYNFSSAENELNLYGGLEATSGNSFFNSKTFYGAPKTLSVQSILPTNTNYFVAHTSVNLEGELRAKMLDSNVANTVKQIEEKYRIDAFANLMAHLDDEYCYGGLNLFNDELSKSYFLIASVSNEEALKSSLLALDTNDVFLNADSVLVGQVHDGAALIHLFGEASEGLESPFYTFINGFLILSDQVENINSIASNYKSGNVLENSIEFGELADWLNAKCNYTLYLNPKLSYTIPKDILNEASSDFYHRYLSSLRSIDHFAYQLVGSKSGFYNHIYLKKSDESLADNDIVFQKEFTNQIEFGPYSVTNYHTGKKEIMVVDDKGAVSQIDQSGNVVWTFVANGKVLAAPYEIDAFGNNKLQFLLATSSNVYLIDRKGNSVGNYPIKLPDEGVGIPARFDFSSDKNDDLLIPCKAGKIYGYTQNGSPVPSWSPMQLDANAKGEMQYFVKSGISYYFISDKKGTIYLWNKKSGEAISPIKSQRKFRSNFTLQFGESLKDCKLLAIDSLGKLVKAQLNGSTTLSDLPKPYTSPFGTWFQFNDAGGKELLVWQNNQLAVFDQGLKKLLEISIGESIAHVEVIDGLKEKQLLAVYTNDEHLYLYTLLGELLLPNPLACSTKQVSFTDFDEDGLLDLVVASNNTLNIHKNIFKK